MEPLLSFYLLFESAAVSGGYVRKAIAGEFTDLEVSLQLTQRAVSVLLPACELHEHLFMLFIGLSLVACWTHPIQL